MTRRRKQIAAHRPRQTTAPSARTVRDRGSRAGRWIPLVLVAAAVAAYSNSFQGVFLFDDFGSIVDNHTIRSLAMFWDAHAERPVVWLSLAANYAWGGLDPRGYHLFNLVVHVLAGLALYGVVRRTFLTDAWSASFRTTARWYALAIALIWILHPLQTQSVTYIVQRSEALMGLFYLLTMYCLVRGAGAVQPVRAGLWYAAAVVACALGMGTKGIMVTAPVIALLYDRTFLARSFAEAFRRRWALYASLGATWVVLVFTGVAAGAIGAVPRQEATYGLGYTSFTPLQYAQTQPGVILHYLKLAFWPHPLCLDYWWPLTTSADAVILPGLVVMVLLAGTLVMLRRWSWAGFLGAWFFIILAPTSSFIPVQDPAFEHRMYLPLAAVVAVIVVGVTRLLRRVGGTRSMQPARAALISATLLVAVSSTLGYMTFQRNKDYASAHAMWGDVVRKRPLNPRAHTDYAKALAERGRIVESIEHCEVALRLKPDYHVAHNGLGIALASQGRTAEAIPHFREAIRLKKDYREAWNNLGIALAQGGETEEGIRMFERALALDPLDPAARRNMAAAYVQVGDTHRASGQAEEAASAYRRALSFDAGNTPARNHLEALGGADAAAPPPAADERNASHR